MARFNVVAGSTLRSHSTGCAHGTLRLLRPAMTMVLA